MVDFSDVVPEGFGSSDIVIVYDGGICVLDYKHGKGVEVSCERNPQLMIYSYGSLLMFEPLYDIKEINMVIIQPRVNNISEWSCSKDELVAWANWNESTWRLMVESAMVHKDKTITFKFYNGREVRV